MNKLGRVAVALAMVFSVGAAFGDTIIYADPVNGDDGYSGGDIGSAEHPYQTLAAAHRAAAAALGDGESAVRVSLSEGRFDLAEPILFVAGESIVGQGADKTFLNGTPYVVKDDAEAVNRDRYLIQLVSADNLMSSLCVTGLTGDVGHTVWNKGGLIEDCRVAYNRSGNKQSYPSGRGIYLSSGTVRRCEIDNNTITVMGAKGAGVYVAGGELTECNIHDNSGTDARDTAGCGVYITGSGKVSRCRIWHNGYLVSFLDSDTAGGVYLANGILENSIVYDNCVHGDARAGGVQNQGGTVRFCTIYGNKSMKDATHVSGYLQKSGTAVNNIIFGNVTTGATVTGGTFENNILDETVTGYDNNIKTLDPHFVDAAALDFHIADRFSPAFGKATPVAGVTVDYDGVERDAEKPTVGAFEFVAGAEDFDAQIIVTKNEWPEGSAPSVELVVTGTPDESKRTIAWYLDETEVPALAGETMPAFAGAALGFHTPKAIVTYGEAVKTAEVARAFAVLPRTVHVNGTGNGTFPYATPETATNVVSVAYGALWKQVGDPTRVEIAAGTYDLGETLNLDCPVTIVGAGRGETTIVGLDSEARLITLKEAGAKLADVTLTGSVTGGGLEIAKGVTENCLVTNCILAIKNIPGAGVRIGSGTLRNCEVVDCHGIAGGGSADALGGGVGMDGAGVVSNCFIHHCYVISQHSTAYGAGVYAASGLIANSVIQDNGDHLFKENFFVHGAGLYLAAGAARVRNVLMVGNSSGRYSVVEALSGTLANCTLTGNTTADGVAAVTLTGNDYRSPLTTANCAVWGNSSDEIAFAQGGNKDYAYLPTAHNCCFANAEEGVDGNTAKDPKFRGGKNKGLGVISSRGSCFRTGDAQYCTEGETDLRGNPRLTDGQVDIGCYQVGFDPGLLLLVK